MRMRVKTNFSTKLTLLEELKQNGVGYPKCTTLVSPHTTRTATAHPGLGDSVVHTSPLVHAEAVHCAVWSKSNQHGPLPTLGNVLIQLVNRLHQEYMNWA